TEAGTQNTYNTLTATHTIAAYLTGLPHTVTVNVAGGGSVTKSPDQPTYPNGTTVQLTAVPNAGSAFSGWSGALTGSTNPANLLMDADKTVTATFADAQGPTATVTSPVGGESWAGGSVHDITWTATDNAAVTAVDLALSTDGGTTFPTAIATGIANSGTFAWTLPGLVSTQARVRVRARDAAGNVGSDSSHTNFSIAGWTITPSAGANGSVAPSATITVAHG